MPEQTMTFHLQMRPRRRLFHEPLYEFIVVEYPQVVLYAASQAELTAWLAHVATLLMPAGHRVNWVETYLASAPDAE